MLRLPPFRLEEPKSLYGALALLALLQRVPGLNTTASQPSTSLKPPEKRPNRVHRSLLSAS